MINRKMEQSKIERMLKENEAELLRLDEIEKGYHENPDLDLEKRVHLLLTVEETRQRRLRLKEKLEKELRNEKQ